MPIYYDLESPLSILAFVHFIFGFGTKSAVPEVGLDRETGIRRTALGSWIRIVFLFVSNGRLERDRFEGFSFCVGRRLRARNRWPSLAIYWACAALGRTSSGRRRAPTAAPVGSCGSASTWYEEGIRESKKSWNWLKITS